MSFLLDTNAVSEWIKPHPNPGWQDWIDAATEEEVFISVISLAEIRFGVERLPAGLRRQRLEAWLSSTLPARFERRILNVDGAVADLWGKVVARRNAIGRPIGFLDALIAATAEVHQLALVTRNVADFEGSVATLVNPWT